jgi:hypothetical protein
MHEFPAGISADMTPVEALAFLVEFLDTQPSEHTLCSAALTIGEPLIDWHWRFILEPFLVLLAESPALRTMVSCCDFDSSVPEPVRDRIWSHVQPTQDIGQ